MYVVTRNAAEAPFMFRLEKPSAPPRQSSPNESVEETTVNSEAGEASTRELNLYSLTHNQCVSFTCIG